MKLVWRIVGSTVVLLALAAGGCGPGGPYDAAPSPTTSSPAGTTEPGTSPTKGTPKGGAVELRGTVDSGVEANCVILRADGKTYNLVGGDKKVLKKGARVVVRGTEKPDMVTTCMQGVPFEVSEARPQ